MEKALKYLNDLGYCNVQIERSLELPINYFKKIKNKKISAATLALLRILVVFPWMIDVAAEKYNKKVADKEMIKAAIQEL